MPDSSGPDRDAPLIIGVDVGTTNVKAVIYDISGRTIALASTPTITHYPQPLWAFFDPEELWNTVVASLRSAVDQINEPERIAGIAVASFGESGIPVDANGSPTYDSIAWFDRRTIPQCEALAKSIGERALFDSTGLSLQPIFSLCKLLWLKGHQPEAWSRTRRWLMAADYVAFRLSGAQATDYSLASRTMAFNIHDRRWDDQLLNAVGISPDTMAPLVQSGERVGSIGRAIAALTGLPEGAAVAAGGHDHVCGALAAGVVRRDQMLDSMGTAEALFFPLEGPITDPELGQKGYSQGVHVVPGKHYLFGGVYTSGASIDWYRDIIGHVDHAEIIREAAALPPGQLGVVFIPHLRLSNAPHNDPKARAAFVGLTSDSSRSDLMRSVYEGLAFEARSTIEPALDFAGLAAMPDISVVGGSARNDLLIRIKASVLNQTQRVLDLDEATSLGAAMLGGIAAGVYASADDAIANIELRSHLVEPDPAAVEVYAGLYTDVFLHLYDALKRVNHRLHDLTVPDAETGSTGRA